MSDLILKRDGSEQLGSTDIYFTSQYGTPIAKAQDAEWISLQTADGRWRIPLVVRPLPGGYYDGQSPYGYSGIGVPQEATASEIHTFWLDSLDTLARERIVAIFLRQSPFVPALPELPNINRIGDQHPVRVMRLDESDSMWDRMLGRSRTAVRKARKNGITYEITPAHADPAALADFKALYHQRMQQLQAPQHLYFPHAYFESTATNLRDSMLLTTVRNPAGEIVAGCLTLVDSEIAHYHLSASDHEWISYGVNNLLLWETARHLSTQGSSVFNLGGGLRPGDNLDKFKQSFGTSEYLVHRFGAVVLDDAYSHMVDTLPKSPPGYFPAYSRDGAQSS